MQRVDGRMNLGHGTRIVDGEFETIDFDSLSHTTNRTISDHTTRPYAKADDSAGQVRSGQ